jgi:2'-5' RNA ligase
LRAFIAVEIPSAVRQQIEHTVSGFKSYALPVKWVSSGNLHVTLRFLGEIDAEKKAGVDAVVKEISLGQSRFVVGLEGIGCFPDPRNPRVIWTGIKEGADELSGIAEKIETGLCSIGFEKEKRFHPHLTIGRIKKPCRIDPILTYTFRSEPFQVDSITLYQSTLKPSGPIYTALNHYQLA